MDDTSRRIGDTVKAFIRGESFVDFDSLAREVFAYQFERNPPYRRFCERRGVSDPRSIGRWQEIPAVPAAAFKEVDLTCAPAALTFRTSGTTGGEAARGRHLVADPSLYDLSLTSAFRRFVLPDTERIRILSLIPTFTEQPDSSLSYMANVVIESFGDTESDTYVREHRALLGAFFAAIQRASAEGCPILIMGTTLAFLPMLEAARDAGLRCHLPAGSRLVDTGGTKGRERKFDERELLTRYHEVLGLSPEACANEYGMTEMLSQFYNSDLARATARGWTPADGVTRAIKDAPPWVRTRVLDPETLTEADEGLLCHLDLANCHSVSAIQTEDLGARYGPQFVLMGRRSGAAARGCSIAMDEWLQ